MRRLPLVAAALFLVLLACAQPAPQDKPWETWQPPEVVLPQPNAFDVYLKAFDLKKQIDDTWSPVDAPPGAPGAPPAADGRPAPPPPPPPPGAATAPDPWPEGPFDLPLAERVALYADVLTLVRQALPMECRIPPPASMEEAMPYFSAFRSVARRFIMDAGQRRAAGDCRGAAESALDALEMAQDAKTAGAPISSLVGMACEAIALASLDQTVPGLTGPECREVLARLQGIIAARVSMADAYAGEERWGRLGFKRFMADPSSLRTSLAASEPRMNDRQIDAVLASMPQAWSLMGEYYETLCRVAAVPYWQRPRDLAPPDNLYLQLLSPNLERTMFKESRAVTVLRLHLLQLAAQAYLRDKGHDPAQLTDIAPEYLSQIPEDPMTGGPLRAVTRDAAYIIYSLGPDAVDDGGRHGKLPVFRAEDKGDIAVVVGAGTNRNP
jgi:hypothetical protein